MSSESAPKQRANERTPLLRDGNADDDHHVDGRQAEETGNQEQEKQTLGASNVKFWLLMLSYSSLLFLFSSNATAITTMYFAIAETLEAYHNAATWMTASYMVCYH